MICVQKEIPREVPPPELNSETIKLLTSLCFRENDRLQEKADLLFVFRSKSNRIEIADINKAVNKVLITGGINPTSEEKINLPEAQLILDLVKPEELPLVKFYVENSRPIRWKIS